MNDKLAQLTEKFHQLEVRMRLMVTFAAALIIGLIIDLVWLTPSNDEIEKIKNEISQIDKQIEQSTIAQANLNRSIRDQRNHPKRKQLEQLKEQTKQARVLLEEKTKNLVPPSEMASVLKEIIIGTGKLSLISLTKQEPQPIFEPGENPSDSAEQIQLYRHSIEIVLNGSYNNTQSFIEALENMKQQVAFDSFKFIVEKYPKSEVRLVVSTLSFDKKWIGG